MRSKAIFMALLALAFGAQAVPVSVEDAKAVARAWARRSMSAKTLISETVESVSYGETESGAPFYAVKMLGGGTVFTSGNDAIEPIVAYTSSQEDFSSIDRGSPLWALLNRDLSIRQKAISDEAGMPSSYVARRLAKVSDNRRQWAELKAESEGPARTFGMDYGMMDYAPARKEVPRDLRVAALVRSKWSQGSVASGLCYNYFTPKNYVCGCVATALGQFLRYNHGPVDDGGRGIAIETVAPVTRTIAIDGDENTEERTTEGGDYPWELMPLVPGSGTVPDEQRRAIGKLLYEAGVALNMSYGATGSGAYSENQGRVLTEVYGYKQALWLPLKDGEMAGNDSVLERNVLFANFDCGTPVLMSIPGHAIVADGYGFEGETPFVHLNMGWAGQDDFWYNLPDMTAAGPDYTTVNGVNYNIFKEEGAIDENGKTSAAVLSGRVLDDDGRPVENCAVTVSRTDDGTTVAELVTGAHGVWSVIAEAGQYDLFATTADGVWIASEEGVFLTVPDSGFATISNFGGAKDKFVVAKTSAAGNSWGHDLELTHPSVRVAGKSYSSLDRAIAEARAVAAESTGPVTIEILENVPLRRPATIDFDCILVATNDDPYASSVIRQTSVRYGLASLAVSNGCELALSNVVFASSEEVPVSVEAGGAVAVAGTVDFGVTYELPGLRTADADGFVLAGALENGITLDCAAASADGDVFGVVRLDGTFDLEAASNSAARIVCASDPYGERRGTVVWVSDTEVLLKWSTPAVPLADAVGYYVDDGGTTNTTARLDRLFDRFADALVAGKVGSEREMVICRPGDLNRSLTVAGPVSIRGENDAIVRDLATKGLTVTNGTLTVSGLAFEGFSGANLFTVNGADAKLVLSGCAVLSVGEQIFTAVRVSKGAAELAGTVINGCKGGGDNGGGVYVAGGAVLSLTDSEIVNCSAITSGGGVYAEKKAEVRIAGDTVVTNNLAGWNAPAADDIYLAGTDAVLKVIDILGGCNAIGVKSGAKGGNEEGAAFAVSELPDGTTEAGTNACARAFFNDAKGDLEAEAVGSNFVWTPRPTRIGSEDGTLPGMVVAVSNTVEKTLPVLYYSDIVAAFDEISGDSVVMLRPQSGDDLIEFASDLDVKYNVLLTTDPSVDVIWDIDRAGDCSIHVFSGASLTIDACAVLGCRLEQSGGDWFVSGDVYAKPLIFVDGGSLTLAQDAEISSAYGDRSWMANAVTVRNGGTFTMEDGAVITDCGNAWNDDPEGLVDIGMGGGLLLDASTAYLRGGVISNCYARTGGGVFAGSESAVYVSGDVRIRDNLGGEGFDPVSGISDHWNDLVVSDNSTLVLDGVFDGSIGYLEGVKRDTNVFGRVGVPVTADIAASASNFWHNVTKARGVVATSDTDAILVWADALVEKDGRYVLELTDPESGETTTYFAAVETLPDPATYPDPKDRPVPPPGPTYTVTTNTPTAIAFSEITRVSDTEWRIVVTDLVEQAEYAVSYTPDLKTAFTTDTWFRATSGGAWTNTVQKTEPAYFWRAHGRTTYVTNWIEQIK